MSFPMDKIEKKHHIGKPRDDRSIEIIVKFVSCRHRALGYAKSKNRKTYNQNEMNDHKSFIEDSLLRQRIDLLFTNKRFYKKTFRLSVNPYDGRIKYGQPFFTTQYIFFYYIILFHKKMYYSICHLHLAFYMYYIRLYREGLHMHCLLSNLIM